MQTNPLLVKTGMAHLGLCAEEFRLPLCEMDPGPRSSLHRGTRRPRTPRMKPALLALVVVLGGCSAKNATDSADTGVSPAGGPYTAEVFIEDAARHGAAPSAQ